MGVENDFRGVLLKQEIPYHDRFWRDVLCTSSRAWVVGGGRREGHNTILTDKKFLFHIPFKLKLCFKRGRASLHYPASRDV